MTSLRNDRIKSNLHIDQVEHMSPFTIIRRILQEEFQLSKLTLFSLSQNDTHKLSSCQWPISPLLFFIYRFGVWIYALSYPMYAYTLNPYLPHINITVGENKLPMKGHFRLAYQTQWSFLLLCIYFSTCLLSTVRGIFNERQEQDQPSPHQQQPSNLTFVFETKNITVDNRCGIDPCADNNSERDNQTDDRAVDAPRVCKVLQINDESSTPSSNEKVFSMVRMVQWLCFNVAFNCGLQVSVVYFSFHHTVAEKSLTYENVNSHLLNSVMIIVDMFMVATPLRLLHVVYSVVYVAIYVFFSLIFWAYDKSNVIYPKALDWNEPVVAGLSSACVLFILTPCSQLLLFCMYRCRILLYNKFCGVWKDNDRDITAQTICEI